MDERNYFAAVVDLETTGLDARTEVPLEVGIKLIDKEGFVFDGRSWIVHDETAEYKEAIAMAKQNQFVGPMHEKSGLWTDLSTRELIHPDDWGSRHSVDEKIVDWLDDNNVRHGSLPMMGNSIGSLDRPFCLVHFPLFNAALSYRNIDMSTIKEIVKAVNPGLYENLKPIIGDKSKADHRVMGDIDACILEYRAYLENFFFTED